MPKAVHQWSLDDRHFFKVIEKHTDVYSHWKITKPFKTITLAWQKVSAEVDLPVDKCQKKWAYIRNRYAKLKNMIFIGRVTEDMVRNHPSTSKFLDGSLDFFNPFVSEIPDWKLPSYAHSYFQSHFREHLLTDDAEKIIEVEGNNFIEEIKDYTQETDTEPMSILPDYENCDDDSSTSAKDTSMPNVKFMDFAMNELMKEERAIDEISNNNLEDVESVQHIDLQMDHPFKEDTVIEKIAQNNLEDEDSVNNTLPAIEIIDGQSYTLLNNSANVATSSQSILRDILLQMDKKEDAIDKSSVNCNVNMNITPDLLTSFLLKYDNNDNNTTDLKQYMNDLAEVLCLQLAYEKRKLFLSQVDLLVSILLEGN